MPEKQIGKVTHYFSKAGVAGLTLDEPLHKGEWIRIAGFTTDMVIEVESREIDRRQIDSAAPGDDVGIKVLDRVRVGDSVYRATPEAGSAGTDSN